MFSKNGINFHIISDESSILDKLEPQVYKVQFNNDTGFYLTLQTESYKLPNKIFNFNESAEVSLEYDRLFVEQLEQSKNNLGILLAGTKGTGKSLLLKKTANRVIKSCYPVILVEDSFNSSALSNFISEIKQSVVVLFDEFEKRYTNYGDDYNSQEGLLSLFDGTSSTRNMFLLTVNNLNLVCEFFINRPSRIKYLINYNALSKEFIQNYLSEYLNNKDVIAEVLNNLLEIDEINFDILETTVNEVNLMYPSILVKDIFNMLNVSPSRDIILHYDAYVYNVEKPLGKISCTLDFEHISTSGCDLDLSELNLGNVKVMSSNIESISGRNHLILYIKTLKNNRSIDLKIEFKRIRNQITTF